MRLKKIRIAARSSDLARLQAYLVGKALAPAEIVYNFKASLGDQNATDPLWKMPQKGVFTEDFVDDLKSDRADLVVHSWKDLPTEDRGDLKIVATLPREDVRDLLLVRRDRLAVMSNSARIRVFTSSPRRSHNLTEFLRSYLPFKVSTVEFQNVRGNIPTRLRKLVEGSETDADALVVAKAALDRLLSTEVAEFAEMRQQLREHFGKCKFMVLPLKLNPAAAAQGALAIEAKAGHPITDQLQQISCQTTFADVQREREVLSSFGGGCHQKIGITALTRAFGRIEFLRGLTDAGKVLDSVKLINNARPEKFNENELYPDVGDELFTRVELPRDVWQNAQNLKYYWISRALAVPMDFRFDAEAIVWGAGLRTWQALARRGVWVTGCAEELGEQESPRLEVLVQQKNIEWTKLTHAESDKFVADYSQTAAIPTYKLVPNSRRINWSQRKACFWMSPSSFEEAVKRGLNPTQVQHACGPGLTRVYLLKRLQELGVKSELEVYLEADDWRQTKTGQL